MLRLENVETGKCQDYNLKTGNIQTGNILDWKILRLANIQKLENSQTGKHLNCRTFGLEIFETGNFQTGNCLDWKY